MHVKICTFLLLTALLPACKPAAQADAHHGSKTLESMQIEQEEIDAAEAQARPGDASTGAHCAENEVVLISCKIEGGNKVASICASKDATGRSEHVYYAFGSVGDPEFIFSADKFRSRERFKRTHLSFAGATGGFAYSFINHDWKYIFYSISGTGFEDHGVMLVPADGDASAEPVSVLFCDNTSLIENENAALQKLVESWSPDTNIDKYGLPPLSDSDSLARCLRHNTEDVCRN